MAMAVDNRQQSQMNALGYDAMRYPQPQFTNPWASTTTASSQLYQTPLSNATPVDNSSAAVAGRPTSISLPYHGLQVTAPSLGAGINLSDGFYEPQNLLDLSQDMMNASRTYTTGYSVSAPHNPNGFAPTSAPHYTMEFPNHSRSPFTYAQDTSRRSSHPIYSQPQRNSFSEALNAGRGLLDMSQDITPRNIYDTQGSSRSSTGSYGFPSTHSTHSSISSASTYPYYASGAEGSVTDYSSASESVDNSRTLPRPSAMAGGGVPPAPQSMMGQFSSKVSSSSQKKHKCKICDKRFTRPSSLQTHMYSHTGEKPFACEVEGCGRHFSVVSNLRRHRKVHKGERDHPSPDDM